MAASEVIEGTNLWTYFFQSFHIFEAEVLKLECRIWVSTFYIWYKRLNSILTSAREIIEGTNFGKWVEIFAWITLLWEMLNNWKLEGRETRGWLSQWWHSLINVISSSWDNEGWSLWKVNCDYFVTENTWVKSDFTNICSFEFCVYWHIVYRRNYRGKGRYSTPASEIKIEN